MGDSVGCSPFFGFHFTRRERTSTTISVAFFPLRQQQSQHEQQRDGQAQQPAAMSAQASDGVGPGRRKPSVFLHK
jgi:hypothetical protein